MPAAEERKGRNEGVFRDANERLAPAARKIVEGAEDHFVPFICECPDPACREIVLMTLDEYAEVRSVGARGLAVPGHEDLSIETVVASNDRFTMTQKFGRAAEAHESRSS